MKRKILVLLLAYLMLFPTYASGLNVSMGDTTVEFCGHTGFPFIDSQNRAQVPLRPIMEALGIDVEWISETQTAVAEKNNIKVEIPIGKGYIMKNGDQIPTNTVAIIKDNRTFLPIRSVLEAFGMMVDWEKETQTVIIGSQQFFGGKEEFYPGYVCLKEHPGDFDILTSENYPGNVLILKIKKATEGVPVKILTDAVKIKGEVFKYEGAYISLLPIDLQASIGSHDISLIFNEGQDQEYKITKSFAVKNKSFKTQYLIVSNALNQSNNDEKANLEFIKVVKPARTISEGEKLWDGAFLMPVEGRLTTDFAEIRYTNNVLSSSRHSGIDLAAPLGTPVIAPNNGKVTLAAAGLLSTGNTLVIDHGLGLFTSYYHLDSINRKVGDAVQKGEIIGTVGTTGFSTGPHLHYVVSIYNTNVNTYQPFSGIID